MQEILIGYNCDDIEVSLSDKFKTIHKKPGYDKNFPGNKQTQPNV